MSDIYGFRGGPTYRGMTRQSFIDSAMEQPLSLVSTFFDQAKGGALESFGLGTAIREIAIPEGEATPESTARSALRLVNPLTAAYESTRLAAQAFREDSPVLDEAKYKSSPWYRQNIPWDDGMTEARAKALAEWDDAKKVRQFYSQKRPISSFIGNLAGQALDPINYVPVAGPAVRAAAAARAGRIAGGVATGALDAAANTALAGLATRETRARLGDDVSWQATVSEIATAALIGSAFGGIAGAIDARTAARTLAEAQRSLSTLKATQEARIALNDAIDDVVRGEDVRLSPNATEAVKKNVPQQVVTVEPGIALANAGYDLKQLVADVGDVDAIMRAATVDDVAKAVQNQEMAAARARIEELQALQPTANAYGPGLRRTDKASPDEEVFDFGMSAITRAERDALIAKETERLAVLEKSQSAGEVAKDIVDTVTAARSDQPARKVIPSDSSLNRTASWVIRDKATGKVVMETFSPELVERVNTAKYEAVPIGQYLGEINGQPKRAIDTSTARPESTSEGRPQAEARIGRPDDIKALSDQYRVNPETGDFPELSDIEQLRTEGRLTADDIAELDAAKVTLDDANAYAEALKTVVGCLL